MDTYGAPHAGQAGVNHCLHMPSLELGHREQSGDSKLMPARAHFVECAHRKFVWRS